MPRLEIELTSERPDGTWTWRAAGAKQPKGVVEGAVVPGGAKVGDVLRAEADFEMDGINVTSLAPPKEASKSGPEVLKLVGSQAPVEGVTTSLVGRRGRDREDRPSRGPRDDRPRGPRSDGPRGPRPEGDRGPRQGPRREGPPRDRAASGGTDTRSRPPRPEGDRSSRPRRPDGQGRSPATPGAPRPERDQRRGPRPDGPGREAAERKPARQRPPRFQPGRTHRDAALAALPEEQRPVAEQILKGGVRAVREALAAQKIDPGPLVTLAENLAPALRAAEWRDRADAALGDLLTVPLRELRAIVTAAADAARGEGAREIADKLKEALTGRVEAQRTEWVDGISAALDANRPLRALRQASRPPVPGARLSAELAARLAQAASAAMTTSTPPARWLDLLDAVVGSPVSRTVRPEGIPDAADEELKTRARAAAGSVPALAPLLGMKVPPPPVRRPAPAAAQSHRRPNQPRPHRPSAPGQPAAADAQAEDGPTPPELVEPPRDEPAEPMVLETTAPLNPVVEAEQMPITEPGSDPEQLDPLGVDTQPAPSASTELDAEGQDATAGGSTPPELVEPPRDEPAEPTTVETTAPLNPVVEAEQMPVTEPGSDPEQLDTLGVGRDHVDDPVLVEELEKPGDDVQLGDLS